jgi:hypothetical protein
MEGRDIDGWHDLRREIEALKDEIGPDAAKQTLRVFTSVVKWQRREGWGDAILSAVDHRFGTKINFRTVYKVE